MKKLQITMLLTLIFLVSSYISLSSKEKAFLTINPDKISRYKEDRVAYQRIEKQVDNTHDNSVENLMVIKASKVYFMTDGLDIVSEVMRKKIILDSQLRYMEGNDFWLNKINGKPDHIKITYRRNELMINANEEFVTNNFGDFYKSIRNKFIKLHVDKFRDLLRNRSEAGLSIKRKLISSRVNPQNSNDIKEKFFMSASVKAADQTIYYCEDADGDGITETFTVTRDDGFDWGIDSGPNIIFIYGNTDKDIETMIGKLTHESKNGTTEEEKKMFNEFPKEKEIIEMMEQIIPHDNFYE